MVVCRILVGVPNGTPLSTDSVTRPGYVMSCSLTSDPQGGRCMPFRGSDTGNDRRLYDVDGEKASKWAMLAHFHVYSVWPVLFGILCAHSAYVRTYVCSPDLIWCATPTSCSMRSIVWKEGLACQTTPSCAPRSHTPHTGRCYLEQFICTYAHNTFNCVQQIL